LKKNEVEENEKLRKTERAINKSIIIIHSCLHFIISTTSFTQKINNAYVLFTRHHCYHLHQLHIIYTIYNVIYTYYNWRRIIIQSKVSLFLVFLQKFEDFYRELLEWINECASLFIRVNKDINYWDWEWTHLEKKTIVMMNWHIKIKSKTELKIRSELTLKLYDFVKTSFRLRHIFNLICHELCHARLDNAWQTLYSWLILLSYRELLNN